MQPLVRKLFSERWWYVPRERVNRQRFPHALLTSDEFCNPTILIQLPFLGEVVVRYKPGPIRTRGGCKECVAEPGPWCDGCETCHRGPRCHAWFECGHESKLPSCPVCGGSHCHECEPEPEASCPHRGETP